MWAFGRRMHGCLSDYADVHLSWGPLGYSQYYTIRDCPFTGCIRICLRGFNKRLGDCVGATQVYNGIAGLYSGALVGQSHNFFLKPQKLTRKFPKLSPAWANYDSRWFKFYIGHKVSKNLALKLGFAAKLYESDEYADLNA